MDVRFNQLSQQIFNKPFEECSEHEIRSFVEQHPYFSPAQFLLLKKLDKNSEAYDIQYQKATLYHQDPVAFDFLINAGQYDFDIENKEFEVEQISPEHFKNVTSSKEETVHEPEGEIIIGSEEEEENNTDYKKEEEKSKIIIPVETSNVQTEQLAFEPFHTVDYFASVGIKLSQDEMAKDRMGKQLKSFTEWLKTMKRLPAPEFEKNMTGDNDQKVENMAADSVHGTDVLTEAMAEVWVKQGNASKAIEVYNKLSLQYPSKSAYFAAKIDHLKEQN